MKSSISPKRRRFTAMVERMEERRLFSDNYLFAAVSSTTIGEWLNTNHQGTGTPTTTIATSGSGSISGLTTSVSVTFDENGGQAIPTGGFTVTADSTYESSNTIWLLGSGAGDTVSSSSSAIKFGSTTVSFTNMALEYYNPNGGTNNLNVTSGTTVLTAGAIGGGIDDRLFSTLSISSGAELYVQPVQENHSDRQVLDATTSAFYINGELDMTNNDMIVHNGN